MAKFDYYDLNKDDVKNRKDYDYYHSNPEEEALATVLFNFKKFRFENAVKALWKRNALVHLGFGALFLIYSPLILLLKVFRRLPKVKKETSSMTRTYLNYHIVSGNVIKCFSIGISISDSLASALFWQIAQPASLSHLKVHLGKAIYIEGFL